MNNTGKPTWVLSLCDEKNLLDKNRFNKMEKFTWTVLYTNNSKRVFPNTNMNDTNVKL